MADFIDDMLAAFRKPKVSPTKSIGSGGTAIWGGYIQSVETNAKLTGTEKYRTYSEILANTSIVAAGTRHFLGLIQKAAWKFEASDEDNGDVAEFVEQVLNDMTSPLGNVVRRMATYQFYGFSVQEWTAKKREDGQIGFLDVETRPQITIEQWDVDRSGTVLGIVQRNPQTSETVYLPRSKCVYAVDDSLSDSPEGLGLFRHVVEAAKRLQRYEQLEGFAFETDLRGIPLGRGPFALMEQLVTDGKMSAEQKVALEAGMKNFIQSHIRSPALGVVLDSATYRSSDEAQTPSDVKLWDMELLKGEGSPMDPVAKAIERLNREIARVLGVESLLLGESGAGSLAMSKDKSANFATLVDGTMKAIADIINKDLIAPLLKLNGIDPKLAPKAVPDKVQFREVSEITAALESLSKSGAVLPPDDPAINAVRALLGLPEQDAEAIAEFAQSQLDAETEAIRAQAEAKASANPKATPPKGGGKKPPVKKANENHDEQGRFAAGDGASRAKQKALAKLKKERDAIHRDMLQAKIDMIAIREEVDPDSVDGQVKIAAQQEKIDKLAADYEAKVQEMKDLTLEKFNHNHDGAGRFSAGTGGSGMGGAGGRDVDPNGSLPGSNAGNVGGGSDLPGGPGSKSPSDGKGPKGSAAKLDAINAEHSKLYAEWVSHGDIERGDKGWSRQHDRKQDARLSRMKKLEAQRHKIMNQMHGTSFN